VALTTWLPPLAGGVYSPPALMVPTLALPLLTPSTAQVTAVFAVPVTVLVYCCVCPVVMAARRGATVTATRQLLQADNSEIAVDHDEGPWHILVAKEADHLTNLLFEQDRLRYVSYDFYLGAYSVQQGSIAHCNDAFARAVAVIAATYGEGVKETTMAWPEREIAITWSGPQHFALAREISDLDGCVLVKAMIFDGSESEFKRFDKRLTDK